MRWVIGILVAVVLVIIGYQYFGSRRGVEVAEQAQQSAEQTAEKTEEAAEAVEKAAEQAAEATQEAGEQAAEATQEAAEATQEAEQAQDTAEQAAAGEEQAAEATQEAQQATEQAAEATQGAAQQATEQAAEDRAAGGAGDRAGGRGHARSGRDHRQEAAEGALTEAQTAALTVGNVNVGEQLTGIMTSLDGTLKGVTDAPSAQAAVPTLNDINTKLDQLSGTVSQLPGDAKKVLADVLSKHVAGLKTLAAEVTAKEGVGPVIKPALDPVIAKLEDWARQPA